MPENVEFLKDDIIVLLKFLTQGERVSLKLKGFKICDVQNSAVQNADYIGKIAVRFTYLIMQGMKCTILFRYISGDVADFF